MNFFVILKVLRPGWDTMSIAKLLNLLDDRGFLKPWSSIPPETPKKRSMIFDQLTEDNTKIFCAQASETIAENILFGCYQNENSPFFNTSVRSVLDNILKIASLGNMRSAVSLALLLHLSKAITDKESLGATLGLFTDLDGVEYEINVKVPSVYEIARRYIHNTPMRQCLLKHLEVEAADLDSIVVRFVDFPDPRFRGWCAPGMVIINIRGLRDTMHLLHHIPLAVLIGHEMRHVLVRKHVGNDFNHSTPESTIRRGPALIDEHHESGLWFELDAIGGKFRFHKRDTSVVEAIEAGFADCKCPALDGVQVQEFNQRGLTLAWNHKAAFEYVPGFVYD
jgi:hypothetical protein